VYVPESADYEVRRELILAGKTRGIHRLNLLKQKFEYLPITTAAMLRAAELWAETRRIGQPTADPKRIDFDTILAAQAQILSAMSGEVVVATSTVGHLSRYVNAALWTELTP
jgi:predicted nucleic acid-binding protein